MSKLFTVPYNTISYYKLQGFVKASKNIKLEKKVTTCAVKRMTCYISKRLSTKKIIMHAQN